jgi:hypothetical protein
LPSRRVVQNPVVKYEGVSDRGINFEENIAQLRLETPVVEVTLIDRQVALSVDEETRSPARHAGVGQGDDHAQECGALLSR